MSKEIRTKFTQEEALVKDIGISVEDNIIFNGVYDRKQMDDFWKEDIDDATDLPRDIIMSITDYDEKYDISLLPVYLGIKGDVVIFKSKYTSDSGGPKLLFIPEKSPYVMVKTEQSLDAAYHEWFCAAILINQIKNQRYWQTRCLCSIYGIYSGGPPEIKSKKLLCWGSPPEPETEVHYLFYERVLGITLEKWLQKHQPSNDVLSMIWQIISVLEVLDKHHITHYDLHSGNIIVKPVKKRFSFDIPIFISEKTQNKVYVSNECKPVIIDWGRTTVQINGESFYSDVIQQFGITKEHRPGFDLYTILFVIREDLIACKYPHKEVIIVLTKMLEQFEWFLISDSARKQLYKRFMNTSMSTDLLPLLVTVEAVRPVKYYMTVFSQIPEIKSWLLERQDPKHEDYQEYAGKQQLNFYETHPYKSLVYGRKLIEHGMYEGMPIGMFVSMVEYALKHNLSKEQQDYYDKRFDDNLLKLESLINDLKYKHDEPKYMIANNLVHLLTRGNINNVKKVNTLKDKFFSLYK